MPRGSEQVKGEGRRYSLSKKLENFPLENFSLDF
jgi:hypothetical protein